MYIGLGGVVSDCSQVSSELLDGSVDVPFRIFLNAECKIEKTFVIFFAEPFSIFRGHDLSLILSYPDIF